MRLAHRTALKRWSAVALTLMMWGIPLAAIAGFTPPRRGIPGRREGGGTRDVAGCVRGTPRLVALVPEATEQPPDLPLDTKATLGVTMEAHPRFFWYMPRGSAKQVTFSLYASDSNQAPGKLMYEATLPVTAKDTVMSLSLPKESRYALEVGKPYRWTVTPVCVAGNPKSGEPYEVSGWVRRDAEDTAFKTKLANADSRRRVDLYAENGLWVETVNTLADLRCKNPNDATLAASWKELMISVGLVSIADKPITSSCQSAAAPASPSVRGLGVTP